MCSEVLLIRMIAFSLLTWQRPYIPGRLATTLILTGVVVGNLRRSQRDTLRNIEGMGESRQVNEADRQQPANRTSVGAV